MFFMTALHHLSAPRGDGLRADLLERLTRLQVPATAENVVAMAPRERAGFIQAGPNPKGSVLSGALPEKVVQFEESARPFKR